MARAKAGKSHDRSTGYKQKKRNSIVPGEKFVPQGADTLQRNAGGVYG
jgi:hypothetical protein